MKKRKMKDFSCGRCGKACSQCEVFQEEIWDLEFKIAQLESELNSQHAVMCSDWEDNKPERF